MARQSTGPWNKNSPLSQSLAVCLCKPKLGGSERGLRILTLSVGEGQPHSPTPRPQMLPKEKELCISESALLLDTGFPAQHGVWSAELITEESCECHGT